MCVLVGRGNRSADRVLLSCVIKHTLLTGLNGAHVYGPMFIVPTIADEGDNDDTADLPDLERETKPDVNPPVFKVLERVDETWLRVWDSVRAALVRRGYRCQTNVRVVERVRP